MSRLQKANAVCTMGTKHAWQHVAMVYCLQRMEENISYTCLLLYVIILHVVIKCSLCLCFFLVWESYIIFSSNTEDGRKSKADSRCPPSGLRITSSLRGRQSAGLRKPLTHRHQVCFTHAYTFLYHDVVEYYFWPMIEITPSRWIPITCRAYCPLLYR